MKTLRTILAATVLATSPFSALHAQSSYDDCMAGCNAVYQQEAAHCDQYPNRLDVEYCYLAIAQDLESCSQACSGQRASAFIDDVRIQRFRPVDIRLAAQTAESPSRG
ncbi:MAG TPA: hypothetical protein VFQ67_08815 [Allosphingosinicella sp.]|nr:hypothetical protein [Allosphingosinicella sp.]